jgi:hypothetical protein
VLGHRPGQLRRAIALLGVVVDQRLQARQGVAQPALPRPEIDAADARTLQRIQRGPAKAAKVGAHALGLQLDLDRVRDPALARRHAAQHHQPQPGRGQHQQRGHRARNDDAAADPCSLQRKFRSERGLVHAATVATTGRIQNPVTNGTPGSGIP